MTDDRDPRIQAISDRCEELMTRIGELAAAGRADEALPMAKEIGEIVGALATRWYAIEGVIEALAAQSPPVRQALDEVIDAYRLPGE